MDDPIGIEIAQQIERVPGVRQVQRFRGSSVQADGLPVVQSEDLELIGQCEGQVTAQYIVHSSDEKLLHALPPCELREHDQT